MAVKDLINAGVGFDGAPKFIITRGLFPTPATATPPPAPPPLTPSGIANALSGRFGPVSTRFRVIRLSQDRTFLGDISTALVGGAIHLDNRRATVRTANFVMRPVFLPSGFDRARDLVQLYVEVYEPVTAQWISFSQGIFHLDTPTEQHRSNASEMWQVLGADLAYRLLQTNFDQTYVVAAGTNYVDAALTIFGVLGLPAEIPPSPLVTPIDKPFPPNTSYWTVVAALMEGINYYPIWADVNGTFRSRERIDPSTEESVITYSTTQEPRMIDGDKDWIKAPQTSRFHNRAVVSIQDVARAPASVEAVNNDPASNISVAIQGSTATAPTVRADYAADQATMLAIAKYTLWDEWGRSYIGTLNTYPDPRRDAHETYTLVIEGEELSAKWRVSGWDMILTAGAPMVHKLETAAPIVLTTAVIT